MKKLSALVIALSLPLCVHASDIGSGPVTRIYPQKDNVYFNLANDTCLPSQWVYYYFPTSNPFSSLYQAMLLTSLSTGEKVSAAIPDGACGSTSTEVTYIYIGE